MSEIHTNLPAFLLVALVLIFLNPAMAFADDVCHEATFIDVNTTLRSHGDGVVVPECFETHLPSAGILMLEVTAPGDAAVEPRLEFLGRHCDGSEDPRTPFKHRDRTAGSVLSEIHEAGSYLFCVVAQDPAQRLGSYKLANGFVATGFDKSERDEDEPDPDPLVAPPCPSLNPEQGEAGDDASYYCAGLDKSERDEDEPDPDPLVAPPRIADASLSLPLLQQICYQTRTDDHGDGIRCATAIGLGEEVLAEIGNGWDDDIDVFSFVVEQLSTVVIETIGSSDTLGGLYDRHGYRLRSDDDSGAGANFRIFKTLSPGLFFVRVEGHTGEQGTYRLTVDDLGSIH